MCGFDAHSFRLYVFVVCPCAVCVEVRACVRAVVCVCVWVPSMMGAARKPMIDSINFTPDRILIDANADYNIHKVLFKLFIIILLLLLWLLLSGSKRISVNSIDIFIMLAPISILHCLSLLESLYAMGWCWDCLFVGPYSNGVIRLHFCCSSIEVHFG